MPMKMGWRWYGEGNDPITLNDIKQIPGVTSIVRRSFFRRRRCSPPSGMTAETAAFPNRPNDSGKNITDGSV